MHPPSSISIIRASEHNLRSVSLSFPKNKLIVVTGVSGSGKSSLIFDVLYREAESRYLGSFSSFARQFMGKMRKPDVERIDGLSPAIALNQGAGVSNPRSTVGTLTGIQDSLRLLFARLGQPDDGSDHAKVSRSLFSFNTPEGACPACKGLGVEDFLDPELLVADDTRTLREGALVITAPNGYIIYSQVTLDVLDQVCRTEGFHIDIPWKDLTAEQKHIVLYGSEKIEIPFGKHPLESRMKWSGITAKPREMGYYKGVLPVMETILQRDRNRNILRFVRTRECRSCFGKRLNDRALSFKINGFSIADLCSLQLDDLHRALHQMTFSIAEATIAQPVISAVSKQVGMLNRLGLSYLSAERESTTLSGGESQRLRLASLAGMGLSGMICIFDEPSVGLHPHEVGQLIVILKELRDKGNTVIVVEHEEAFMQQADWMIDIGPGPGIHGGEVLFNGTLQEAGQLPESEIRRSRTLSSLKGFEHLPVFDRHRPGSGDLVIEGASARNLQNIDVTFKLHALNVVTGVSGAGKSTLVHHTLGTFLANRLYDRHENTGRHRVITGWQGIRSLISIDQSPIGRTPRSNPATYTGLFDHIRDVYANTEEARKRGYDKGRFSFNTVGGRCELCEGAGYQPVGMHFMGNVEVLCEACEGRRFDEDTLAILVRGKNISEILEMSVTEGLVFFSPEPKIRRYLETLDSLGLGYLTLGQRSSTLSGGEAQRIKLATELAKPQPESALYIMDEPTTGLHQADTGVLLKALDRLIEQGHTVILIEHHQGIIAAADHVVDLGPGSGKEGGRLLFSGPPSEIRTHSDEEPAVPPTDIPDSLFQIQNSIILRDVTTHNLKHINVSIPHNKITVITGVSGSGKSSLAFDTIFAEGQYRFLESFSPYVRSRLGVRERADFEEISGLTPTFAVDQSGNTRNPRSTAGTMTGIYDHYRLLFSRIGVTRHASRATASSSLFSFNHQHGACPVCGGLGSLTECDPEQLITDPCKSLLSGALDGTRTGKFYGDIHGQYIATLKAAGEKHGIDFSPPWNEISQEGKTLALDGTGDEQYDVTWQFRRDERTGQHQFRGQWKGLLALINEEYTRKHADHRGESMMALMQIVSCQACQGSRLQPEALSWFILGKNISALSAMQADQSINFFRALVPALKGTANGEIVSSLVGEILRKLEFLSGLGLSYLSMDRMSSTLSGGETGRVRLAGQLGSGLTGITYVLDEPTIGLHPKDTVKLMNMIRSLQAAGNTVIIVEHDREVILAADHVIDMGPGAGKHGGQILAIGSPAEIMHHKNSVTGPYLADSFMGQGFAHVPNPSGRRGNVLKPGLFIRNACAHNLKGFDLEIPMGGIIAFTGVSGSGKSTLLFDVIHASAEMKKPTGCSAILGFDNFQQLVRVDQRAGFNSSVATTATFTGIFDRIRNIFSAEPMAASAGIGKNYFSFNNKEGRCPVCEGSGQTHVSMDFLSDVRLTCETCGGKRYRPEVLSIMHRGKNIADMLNMTVSGACDFFETQKNLAGQLQMLEKVGLGYLQLGQSLDTLSGGESQRLALAAELMKPGKEPTLYLLDEPSTGLHFRDIEYLLVLFHQLITRGNTLLIIEHDPLVIAQADHVIELGPEGGAGGGFIVRTTFRQA